MKRSLYSTMVLWSILVVGTAVAAALPDTSAPVQPAGFGTSLPGRHQLKLTWTAPSEDTGSILPDGDPTVNASAVVFAHLNVGPSPSPTPTGGPCHHYDIRYSTTPIVVATPATWDNATQVAVGKTPSTPGTSEWTVVTGLSSGQLYYFGIKAYDEAGNVSPMALTSGTTLVDNLGPATVITLIVSDTTDNSATLSWNAPADDDGAKVAAYDIRYSLQVIDSSNWAQATPASGEPTPKDPTGLETMTVGDLGGGTYSFALVSYDVFGNPSAVSALATTTLTGRIGAEDAAKSPCSQSASGAAPLAGLAVAMAALLLRR